MKMKILLDNGHGITTKGKRSPDGRLLEYQYARRVANAIVAALTVQGYDACAIVPENADIALGERANRVNAVCDTYGAGNVLLVSIHCNAAGSGATWMNARGWEAWTSKGQTQGDRLADCLYDAASKCLPKGIPVRTDFSDGDRDKEESFTILTRTRCAACLTENLFQDNRADVDYLLSPEGFETIVRLHVEGIKNYVAKYGKK